MPGHDPAATVLLRNLDAVMAASQVMAAGQRSNDACLRARRQLEHTLNLHGAQREDYLDAARSMEDAGLPLHADTLRLISDTEPELIRARMRWEQRRAARPESPAERVTARWLSEGLILPAEPYTEGIDGCYYGLSRLRGDLLAPREAGVTVVTSARRPQLVAGFPDLPSAREWRLDRTRHAAVPLAGCRTGPECRLTREERLLAGLLRRPRRALADLDVSEQTWTSDLRAEIFLAWQSAASRRHPPSPDAIAANLQRRMLRAPEDHTGPVAGLAAAYLTRLHATDVPAARFLAAARELSREDQATAALVSGADVALEELARLASRPPGHQPLRAPPGPEPAGPVPGH